MIYNLTADCLNEIFEFLNEKDLFACLLVMRLWCEIAVRLLWRRPQSFESLLACLPNESRATLIENGVIIPTSRPPFFNYVAFIRNLRISDLSRSINKFDDKNKEVIKEEILKMIMKNTYLKKLCIATNKNQTNFLDYQGREVCLSNLSEFKCCSNISSDMLHKLSITCKHLKTLRIKLKESVSDGLEELITSQSNLKYLDLRFCYKESPIQLFPITLTKLRMVGVRIPIPFSMIPKLPNLQELTLAILYESYLEDFKDFQYVSLPQLQILKFENICLKIEYLMKFLENNGKNLEELCLGKDIKIIKDSFYIKIANCCPKLRLLRTVFPEGNLNSMKVIVDHCKNLKDIYILCSNQLDPKATFQWGLKSSLVNRMSSIPLSLTISFGSIMDVQLSQTDITIIRECKDLGVIKRFVFNNHIM
ncbi:14882_t:CDS:1 [Funneliformis mosseae]|uniref:14882_t:CDS:1 n=1 Tax=Funneliformis mosseae TaxID=27381 RepID=A0A9N8W175_FUNMO|nr:14882_t:CDS:1 [Funneliformis mosseae]